VTQEKVTVDGGGLKNDRADEKVRVELVDPDFVEGVGNVLTYGAVKYEAHNWMRGMKFSRIIGGMRRHLLDIERRMDYDADTGLQHAYHLACGTMFLAHYIANRHEYAAFDDRVFGLNASAPTLLDPSASATMTVSVPCQEDSPVFQQDVPRLSMNREGCGHIDQQTNCTPECWGRPNQPL
jgi:hypothetical protein